MSKYRRTCLLMAVALTASLSPLRAQQRHFEVTGRLRCNPGFSASMTFFLTLNGNRDSDEITIDCVSGSSTRIRVQAFNTEHPPNDASGTLLLTDSTGRTTRHPVTLNSLPGRVIIRGSPSDDAVFSVGVPEEVMVITTQ
jgi:hypothetical protein